MTAKGKQVISRIIFGDALNRVSIPELSRRTGISESTLRRYRSNPAVMTLDRLALICRARGIGAEGLKELIKWG